MSKPDNIPEWAWDRAGDASLMLVTTEATNQETIALAILAAVEEETEACAALADEGAEDEPYGHAKARASLIASAIRARKGN